MTGRRDDDALSWGGDDDPTLDVGTDLSPRRSDKKPRPSDAAASALPDGFTAVGRGSETLAAGDESVARPGLGNVELIALGVVGATYLFVALGWIVGGLRLHGVADFLVSSDGAASPTWSAGNLAAVWLAVLSPGIWFTTVFLLTRRSKPWLRWTLLVAGALLLLPWPFIMVGAVGS